MLHVASYKCYMLQVTSEGMVIFFVPLRAPGEGMLVLVWVCVPK